MNYNGPENGNIDLWQATLSYPEQGQRPRVTLFQVIYDISRLLQFRPVIHFESNYRLNTSRSRSGSRISNRFEVFLR